MTERYDAGEEARAILRAAGGKSEGEFCDLMTAALHRAHAAGRLKGLTEADAVFDEYEPRVSRDVIRALMVRKNGGTDE